MKDFRNLQSISTFHIMAVLDISKIYVSSLFTLHYVWAISSVPIASSAINWLKAVNLYLSQILLIRSSQAMWTSLLEHVSHQTFDLPLPPQTCSPSK